jgi:hypothetical protein
MGSVTLQEELSHQLQCSVCRPADLSEPIPAFNETGAHVTEGLLADSSCQHASHAIPGMQVWSGTDLCQVAKLERMRTTNDSFLLSQRMEPT